MLLYESMMGQSTTWAARAAVAEQTRATAHARLRRWVSDDAQSVVLLGSEDASLAADGLLVDMAAVKAKKQSAAAVPVAESIAHPDGSLRSDCVTHDFVEHNTVRSGDEWMVCSPHSSSHLTTAPNPPAPRRGDIAPTPRVHVALVTLGVPPHPQQACVRMRGTTGCLPDVGRSRLAPHRNPSVC